MLGQGGTHSPPPGERQAQGAGQGHGHHDDVDRQAGDGGAVSACRSGAWRWWRQERSESYRKGRGLIGKDGNGAGKGGAHVHKGAGPTKLHWRTPRTPPLAAHVAHTHPDHVTLPRLWAWELELVLWAARDGDLGRGQVRGGTSGVGGGWGSLRGQLTAGSAHRGVRVRVLEDRKWGLQRQEV